MVGKTEKGRVMWRSVAALALVGLLGGCGGWGSGWARTCQSWGLEYGTADYANCMAQQQALFWQNTQQNLQNIGQAGKNMTVPSVVPGGPMVPGAGW